MEQEMIERFLQTKSGHEFQELKMQLGFVKLAYTELPSVLIQHLQKVPLVEGQFDDPDVDEDPPEAFDPESELSLAYRAAEWRKTNNPTP